MTDNMKRTALIVGCGYTGMRLGQRLAETGVKVVGTSRRAKGTDLQGAGIEVLAGELHDPAVLASIGALKPSLVAYFVPPQRQDDPLPLVIEASRHAGLEAFLYAGSTGVYGDRGGEWVDETTPIIDKDPTGDPLRHAAERVVLEAGRQGAPTRICRISGIYGPGRTLRSLLETGAYTLIEGHDPWVGRIHVDDLVSGFLAAWTRGSNGAAYNMVDQRPHLASEFSNLSADLNKLPRPPIISLEVARARHAEAELRRKLASKRLRCERLQSELGVEFKYPTYLTGLPAAVAADAG